MPEYECPVCDTGEVFDREYDLASHLLHEHGWHHCPCGIGPVHHNMSTYQFLNMLAKHIAKVEDWELHIAQAELFKVAREKRGL